MSRSRAIPLLGILVVLSAVVVADEHVDQDKAVATLEAADAVVHRVGDGLSVFFRVENFDGGEVVPALDDDRFATIAWPSRITRLDLERVDITDVSFGALASLKSLEQLGISSCARLTDEGLAELLKNLDSLGTLYLNDLSVGDNGLRHVGVLKKLRYLTLSRTDVTDVSLEFIANASSLEELSVSRTSITGSGFAHLATLKRLVRLELVGCHVETSHLRKLPKLSGLRFLNLDDCDIDDEVVEHLSRMKQLSTLRIIDTDISKEGVDRLRAALPECKIVWRPVRP